ncbi:tripartite tricarboxylate transporter TctB family protein [Actinoplanes bogorensis]|uniref:Tripartite tricarboxylate transporter TctB family protein n=1 Tax=Paractinoplanes bogorensis TaxID=1610840 RepID=A0ABS5YK59_9ACTN|nr:tripartite tricarboxylate transporter TctB family protein [Actinoplanes bogorensis]MBU2663706.1 tripartite tricarboxylate transporter TctB family protein [Actinoplanes bogorensis]
MSSGTEPVRQASQGRRTGVVLAAGLLVVGVLLLWSAATAEGDFGLQGPRLAPVVVTVAWVVAAAYYLFTELRPRADAPGTGIAAEAPADSTEEDDREEPGEHDPEGHEPGEAEIKPGWRAPAGVLGTLVGFAIALEYAGFVVSAALFIVLTARVLGSRHLVRDVIVAIVLPIAIYLSFTRLLDIFLPAGVFPL